MKKMKGITWAHSRGFTSIVAVSQRYSELHPEVEIVWEKRSLQKFADAPVEKLAEAYDLLIIDHLPQNIKFYYLFRNILVKII